MAKAKMTFEAWMRAVDVAVAALVGLSVRDLPDFAFRDAFDSGRSPAGVAKAVVRAAMD